MLRYSDDVTRLGVLRKRRDRPKNELMIRAIEILGSDDIADVVPRAAIEHYAAQHGLLRLDRVRWHAALEVDDRIAFESWVAGHG